MHVQYSRQHTEIFNHSSCKKPLLWVQYYTVITAINKNSELTQISLLKSAFVNLESNDFMTMRPSCSNAPLFAPNLGGLNIRSPAVSATYFSELISKKKLELCS